MALMGIDSFSAHRVARDDALRLDGPRTALLIVDMVRDFLEPTGAMPLPGAGVLIDPINAVAAALRRAGGLVVWVRDEHDDPQDAEFRLRTPHCLLGTGGSELAPELVRDPVDHDLTKRRYSAFYGTDLERLLRERGVSDLLVCGVASNICVRSTIHDAFFHDFDVVLLRDCCLATSTREQESTLYDIETHFGRVADSARVRALLRPGGGR